MAATKLEQKNTSIKTRASNITSHENEDEKRQEKSGEGLVIADKQQKQPSRLINKQSSYKGTEKPRRNPSLPELCVSKESSQGSAMREVEMR